MEEEIDAAFDLAAFLPGNAEDFGNAYYRQAVKTALPQPIGPRFIDLGDRHSHLGAMKFFASFSRFRHQGGQLLAGL